MEEARYPQPGTVLLGKFVVESLIGIGGMGAVIKAHHRDLDEWVAIKCLLPEQHDKSDIVARFLREAKAVVRLKNPHVARVFDVGKLDDGTPIIVMEYLDGPDLARFLKQGGPLASGPAVDLLLQACEAIAEAHSIGVIHRDIKSSNFVLTETADRRELKVLDFGIATAPEGTSDLTTTDSVFGTPAYMAPEQMRQARIADERSDIWSLGIVLYECLEGRRPFRADSSPALVLAVGMDAPEPMVLTPGELRPVVLRCLEKSPEARYQTVAQLAEALQPYAGDVAHAAASVLECARMLRRSPARRSRDSLPPLIEAPTVRDRPREPTSVTGSNGEAIVPARPRRTMRWVLVGVIAGVTGGALAAIRPWETDTPGSFPAPPIDDSEQRAKTHFDNGERRFAARDFAGAITEYQLAYDAKPLPAFLFNIAQSYRNLGDHEAAIAAFEKLKSVTTDPLAYPTINQLIDDVKRSRDNTKPDELFELARTQRNAGKLEIALATLVRARDLETNPLARQMIEQTIADIGAERIAKSSRVSPPTSPVPESEDALLRRAQTALATDPKLAATLATGVARKTTNSATLARARILYGDALFAQGAYQRARDVYSAVRQTVGGNLAIVVGKKITECDRRLGRSLADPFTDPVITRESVTARFLSVKRGYDKFKATHGSRLDTEWNDLMIFLQSMRDENLVEADNRIEEFRLKVREALILPGSSGSSTP